MKKTTLIAIVLLLFIAGVTHSQVNVNVTFGVPPPWGPIGYTEVRYYYLPDIEAYYDINTSMFIYYSSGRWVHRTYLPARYRYYDLYDGYKVVLTDYRGNAPYEHFVEHRAKYRKGYHGDVQHTIGEKPENWGHSKGGPHYQKQGRPGDGHQEKNSHQDRPGNNKGHGGGKGKNK